VNCDRIAPAYRWLEYAAFGRELERRRFRFLAGVAARQRALILGDGDGRFLARFAAVSDASVDYVDSSARMLELARARAGTGRVDQKGADTPLPINYRHSNALELPLHAQAYDLIVTHFFLDCFDAPDLERLIKRIREAAQPGALWLISEFRQPIWARPLLAAMYLFFRATAGLSNTRLVDHRPLLQRSGFRLLREETSRRGLLASELWQRSE
jgi:ubiquinone/menaquinone biosynthesis C-methylase UbiE